MSRWALFYNRQDLTPIVAEAQSSTITLQSDRQLALRVWNGGLNAWDSAPVYTGPQAGGDADCRICIVNANQVTLVDFIAFLRRRAAANPTSSDYLRVLAEDIEFYGGGIEPPPAGF